MERSIAKSSGVEFLATTQICCVLLLKNMLYTNINQSSSTIPPHWLIKSFHSTIHMNFSLKKWCPKCHALGRKISIAIRSQQNCSHAHVPDN